MNIGNNISIHMIRDGTLMVDGGVVFGQLAKPEWEQFTKPDRRNRVRLAMNTLLVQTPGRNVLIDTGAGDKRMIEMKEEFSLNGNKLIKGLREQNLNAGNIDIVVLTNLHSDHSGGCTKLDRTGTAIPRFPNAKYKIQKASLAAALSPNERFVDAFYEDDYEPLAEQDLIDFLDDEDEIVPGITVKLAEGPSQGNQIVFIEYGSERIVYPGDLIPTPFHLPLHHIQATAEFPNDTLVQKRELIEMVISDGWLIVFCNGDEYSSGYLQDRGGIPHLVPAKI